MIVDSLKQTGAFLDLSRTAPQVFDQPFAFDLVNGTQVEIVGPGIISFTPEKFGNKDIVLSSGIHGNETAPIEICDQMVKDILTGQLVAAHRVLFIFGNLPAMDLAERFVEENLNRLFSGTHSQAGQNDNQERQRARELELSVEAFFNKISNMRQRFHYDLHTAIRPSKNDKFAVYPFLHGKPWDRHQLAFMLACGVNTILLSESPTTTFSYFSSHQFNAHAFTVELGRVQPFGHNDMSQFAEAIVMFRRLVSESELGIDEFNPDLMHIYRVNQVINKTSEDFKLHFDESTPNFMDFAKGTVLASESGIQYTAEFAGEAIVFPNANVAIGQRALLTVVPTEI